MKLRYLFLFLVLFSLMNCSNQKKPISSLPSNPPPPEIFYLELAQKLASQLVKNLHPSPPPQKIIVVSFLQEEDLSRSSPLGRLLAELLAQELQKRGFEIFEARLTRDILLKPREGEIVLSRKEALVFREIGAQAVVTGIISSLGGHLIVQAKMISLADSRLLSAATVELKNYVVVPTVYDEIP